jgi:hypothetical protein
MVTYVYPTGIVFRISIKYNKHIGWITNIVKEHYVKNKHKQVCNQGEMINLRE